jgi:hypothetical protein
MQSSVVRRLVACAVVGMASLSLAGSAAGQEASAPSAVSSGDAVASPTPPDARTAQVRALLGGTLDVTVAPQALFDVVLDDEAAILFETARVRAFLRAVDEAARPPDAPTRPRTPGATPAAAPDAAGLRSDFALLDPALLRQRVELDRARLEFYQLSTARRTELLQAHAARREAAQPLETEAERRARAAEAERARALEAVRVARSEAERVVAEELARLIALDTHVRALRDEFRGARDEIAARRDAVLVWQRRVRDAKASGAVDADAAYDALRAALRFARDDLSTALDALNDDASVVPSLGPDPLADIPPDIPAEAARERRVEVDRALADVRRDERALEEERASALLDEINTLNRERLGLLPALSAARRDAITGFTSAGWDQARSEARHLALILRYHQRAALAWVQAVRTGGTGGVSAWRATVVGVPVLLVVGAFVWGRRKTHALLRWGDLRLGADERAERRTTPSVVRRAVRLLLRTHRSLEWILFFLVISWLLPAGGRSLLEVQLLSSMIMWTLAGSLAVNVVNGLAAGSAGSSLPLEESEPAKLRLRSLRLVGRTVVVFALILLFSARLVGEGTLYSWVFSTCWFAAIPVFLLLVKWWRSTVFERLERLRKKTAVQAWILANRSGWKSFGAAMVGAVQLFTTGAIKLGRSWLSGFELARRIHAYLFKRELDRIGEGQAHTELTALTGEVFGKLDPERSFDRWLNCPADAARDVLCRRAQARQGALVVVVAPRGLGKSSLLRAITQDVPDAVLLDCRSETSVGQLCAAVDSAPSILLMDDAHAFIEPRIGGLSKFDEIIAFARAHSERTTWVFSIDASVWPFLRRARDARPLFDDVFVLAPWDEAQLGALLADRCEAAGIVPQYDGLLDRLPPGADEIDRQDALKAKRTGYERMLWDHVSGNPGLALEALRVSLGCDETGTVHVRPLQVPDVTRLERLPDSSLFVLRAVLQLAPSTAESVAQATRLRPEEVLQDLRFGKAQGFYEERFGSVRIAWTWLRAVSRLLERRQLLVRP